MNIIFIAYSCNPYNGTEDKIGWNVPYYSSYDNSVIIITKRESEPFITRFLSENDSLNIRVEYVDIPDFYKKVFSGSIYSGRLNIWNRKAYRVVLKICENEKVDIIHQVNPVEFRSIGPYGNIDGVPFVCGPVGGGEYMPQKVFRYASKFWYIECARRIANIFYKMKYRIDGRIKKCNKIIFANDETRSFLIKATDIKKYDVMTELGSCDVQGGEPAILNRFTILTGGRLIYRKGFDLLLDAVELVPTEYDFALNIVGDGPLFNHLKKRCMDSNVLQSRVKMLGRIQHNQMGLLYNHSNVFILPSLRETTGSVIMESIENGVPVIAPRLFGGKVLLDETCAVLYDYEKGILPQQTIANTIEKCIKNKDIIKEMRDKCLKKAAEHSFKNKSKQFQTIYEELLKSS